MEHGLAFLGVCDRAVCAGPLRRAQPGLSILGLRSIVVSHIYPTTLPPVFVFAVHNASGLGSAQVRLLSADNVEVGNFTLSLSSRSIGGAAVLGGTPGDVLVGSPPVVDSPSSWVVAPIPSLGSRMVVPGPGLYKLVVVDDSDEIPIGTLACEYARPLPLTKERIAAIKSDANALRSVRAIIHCRLCDGELRAYAGLERLKQLEDEGYVWYSELPTQWQCKCGTQRFDLSMMRESLHGYLGWTVCRPAELSPTRLYEKTALESIRDNFQSLLDSDPEEPSLQKFIEDNEVLLYQFAPQLLAKKPSVLGKFFGDFAIWSMDGSLCLVEIEKPGKKVFTKKGDRTKHFNHAHDQIINWFHQYEEHRAACLSCLHLEPKQVSRLHGVILMGRDATCDPAHLKKLKAADLGKVTFLTWDDLIRNINALIKEMQSL